MHTIRTGQMAFMGIAAAVQREQEDRLIHAAGMTCYAADVVRSTDTPALFQRDAAPQPYACVATGPEGLDHQILRERAPVKVTHIERFGPTRGRISFMYSV